MIVVVDSTPLIALIRIGRLELLHRLFGKILIPKAVFEELTQKGKDKPGYKDIKKSEWIIVKQIKKIDVKEYWLMA